MTKIGPALERAGFDVIPVPVCRSLDPRLEGHPDLQIFAANGYAFVHPDADDEFVGCCSQYARVIRCTTSLGRNYPLDCPYNIAFTGEYALCKEQLIPAEIRNFLDEEGIPTVDIPQGYAKCSIIVVDEKSIITEDEGIRRKAELIGFDVLTVRKGFITLDGFPHGFIGGISGMNGGSVYLTGDIAHHPDHGIISSFIEKRGKRIELLSPLPAADIGSIIFL
ncbi:MAG TPA: hypothetical protein PKK43_06685 [Spirochaetota bacterium]|nr:hypothetical protein [Spirochaetota bacterium]